MLGALLLAAILPVATPDPAVVANVDAWIAAADSAAAAGNPSDAASNLWRAADTSDRKLRDYPRAIALYDRLLREFPAARLARGAATRREYVVLATSKGAEPFARFERVRADFAKIDHGDARDEVAAILADHPDFPLADEVLLWLGDRAADDGDAAGAVKHYRALLDRFPESPQAAHAWAGLGRAAFAAKDWATAEEAFSKIAGTSVAGADIVSRKEVEMVRRHRTRAERLVWVLAFLAAAGVAAVAAIDPRRLRSAVRASVGRELLYVVPIAVVLVVISPQEGRMSIALILGAGVVFLWAALVWADAVRPALTRPALRAVSTVAGTLTGAAMVYVVLYALDLLAAVERLLGEA